MKPLLMVATVELFATYPPMIAILDGSAAGPAAEKSIIDPPDPRVFFEEPEIELALPYLALGDLTPSPRQNTDENMPDYKGTFSFAGGAETPMHAWLIADKVLDMLDAGGIPWPVGGGIEYQKLWISQAPGVTWSPEAGCWIAQGQIGFQTQRFMAVEGDQ